MTYLVVLALLTWLAIASYQQVFADRIEVTLTTRTAGQQLNVGGDVRMNGAIVGRVSQVTATGRSARITLQIDRSAAKRIPDDVQGRVLPTTLFGQKFVELRSERTATAGRVLVEGDQIREDRSAQAIELTDVLDDLDPVLSAIAPDRLSLALGGLADGLNGRGETLRTLIASGGRTVETLNAETPLLLENLALFDKTVSGYADAAPDLLALLANSSVTARAVNDQPGTIAEFIRELGGAASSGQDLLARNASSLDRAAALSRPTLELLAAYSPEFRCVISGFLVNEKLAAAQIRHNSFQGHFTIGQQTTGYTPEEALILGDLGTGPACRGLPSPAVPYPGFKLNNGAKDRSPTTLGLPDLLAGLNGAGSGGGR